MSSREINESIKKIDKLASTKGLNQYQKNLLSEIRNAVVSHRMEVEDLEEQLQKVEYWHGGSL